MVFDYQNNVIYTKPNSKINEPFEFNMSGIEIEHAGLEWVKETSDEKATQGIKVYTSATDERIQENLKIRFELKPIFKISSVRIGSDAEKAGLKVGDKLQKINHQQAHGLTIQIINGLFKSEEGKTIEVEVERNSKTYKYQFMLKKII